jgi:pfkB family carbohydrate kinase
VEKRVTAGFDGFVDIIAKIIRNKPEQEPPTFFNTIREFGNYILEKEGTSFSLELLEQNLKLGGNMPIMANALGKLGMNVNCVGALGYPQMHTVFKDFPSNCRFYSFADPGTSTAFEFNDGKIMLAQMGSLNTLGWNKIKNIIGIDTLINLYGESDLLCMVNWSEIDASSDIWEGILKDVFPHYAKPGKKQVAFFDLSDCSKRTSESVNEALMLLKEFGKYTEVGLSLNKNEARYIYQVMYNKEAGDDLSFLGERIFEKLKIDILVLHSPKEAVAFNNEGRSGCNSFFIKNPTMSTGAGDNFNSGFCAAQLLKLDLESSLIFANSVAGFYVKTGISPQLADAINFLDEMKSDS